jgi:N-acetylmuramate 1-kinase
MPTVCIHRDFQSENIIIDNGHIKFVDYQGARLGPAHYDAVSLIFDPYVSMGQDMMERLAEYYLTQTGTASQKNDFYICAAQRLMQALGAYANLSLHKDKPRYREFIPTALERLYYVMEFLPEYPAIKGVVHGCQ